MTVFRKAAETAKERLPDTSPFARTALERFFDFSSETPDRDKIPDDLVRSAEASSGSGSPYGMGDAYRRAEALLKEKKIDEALAAVRKATATFKSSYPMLDTISTNVVNLLAQVNRRNIGLHLAILRYHYAAAPQERHSDLEESFEIGQLLDGAVGQTIAKMSARSTGATSDRVRRRQDLIDEIRHKQHALTELIATGGNLRTMTVAQRELATTRARFTELDEDLKRDPAAYHTITQFPILSSSEVRGLLKRDESLVKYYIYSNTLIIWGISGNQDKFCTVNKAIDEKKITSTISKIRDSVDPEQNPTLTAFPAGDAFSLWRLLFNEIETCLGQTHTFHIVPDGIIGNIPFSILVTKKPVSDNPDYKDVEWLSRQFATVYLPSVNSLRALRRVDHVIDEPRAFVGVGDPVLRGSASVPRDSHVEATLPKGQLDLKGIRSLPALPEAARELKAMAHALHADEQSSLFLEQRASKTVLFRAPELGKAQIIAFATHGLMSGDFGLQEPALVLTPQLPEDDGLLKVSDILGLHLNAEWVVLSACNTAAGDIGAYNGISSLASAFF